MITGYGVISPIGLNRNEYWDSLIQEKCGIGPINKFDTTNYPIQVAGEVHGFDGNEIFGRKEARRMDIFAQYAIVATKEALEHAGLEITPEIASKTGIWISASHGGYNFFQLNYQVLLKYGPKRVSPFLASGGMVNAAGGEIAILLGTKGPTGTIQTGGASGMDSVARAARMIQYGQTDVMLAGASEDAITPLAVLGEVQEQSKQLTIRPYDVRRDGYLLGNGAGVLVLEELEHAKKRGATILGEVLGFAQLTDPHLSERENIEDKTSRMAQTIQIALKDANISPHEIDYIQGTGLGLPELDLLELHAYKEVFGSNPEQLHIRSNKSLMGYTVGASSALDIITALLVMEKKEIPKTSNLDLPEPILPEHCFFNHDNHHFIQNSLVTAFTIEGHMSAMVLAPYKE